MRSSLRGQLEAAGEVRVQHVEASRPEPELDGLVVDENVVAERDGPRQRRIRDARTLVHLEPDESVVTLHDRGHPSPPKRDRH